MRLTLTVTEFVNVMACFLYDQVTHPEDSIPAKLDQDWADLLEVFNRKGMKSPLLQYYLQNDPQIRIRYNLIKKVFTADKPDNVVYIEIRGQKLPEQGIVKKTGNFLKKIVTLGLLK